MRSPGGCIRGGRACGASYNVQPVPEQVVVREGAARPSPAKRRSDAQHAGLLVVGALTVGERHAVRPLASILLAPSGHGAIVSPAGPRNQEPAMRRLNSANLVSLFVLAAPALPLATAASADVYHFQPIALTGDPVPGVPGAQFTWLGTGDAGPDDPAPLIDAQGNVSFGGGWTQQFSPQGLFVRRGKTLEPIVLTGDPATGTGTTFTELPGLIPGPARVSGTFRSFDGAFVPSGQTATEQGVWADRGGPRELIFRQSDHPPGTVATARFFQWFHILVGQGHVVVNARYSVGSSSAINDHGFWRDDGAGLQVVALARTQ